MCTMICRQSLLLAVFWVIFLLPVPLAFAQGNDPVALPPGAGRDVVVKICTQCHDLERIQVLRNGRTGWKNIVEEMAMFGAQLLPSEAETVINYLTANLGPDSQPLTAASPPAEAGAKPSSAPVAKDKTSLFTVNDGKKGPTPKPVVEANTAVDPAAAEGADSAGDKLEGC